MLPTQAPTPLQRIFDPHLAQYKVRLFIKRDDLIDPGISGNKWRKLKYNLAAAKYQGYSKLLTFGGAYSNHIYATAAAGKRWGFATVGVIRGEAHWPLNSTLNFAVSCGMTLCYLDRQRYRHKESPALLAELRDRFGDFYLLPEGGSNGLALEGCGELVSELITQTDGAFDIVTTPCGTGGTLAGIAKHLPPGKQALGVAVLKGGEFLNNTVQALLQDSKRDNWKINTHYHFGGYAKSTAALRAFMEEFEKRHGIILEPIYTAKMLYGLYSLITADQFLPGTTVIALHTGGLQGRT